MVVPSMGEDGWFDASSAQGDKSFLGVALCMVGFFITAGIGGMLLFWANARKISAFAVQQGMPLAQEGLDKIGPTLGKIANDIKKGSNKETKRCSKCGATISKNEAFCSKCGKKQY